MWVGATLFCFPFTCPRKERQADENESCIRIQRPSDNEICTSNECRVLGSMRDASLWNAVAGTPTTCRNTIKIQVSFKFYSFEWLQILIVPSLDECSGLPIFTLFASFRSYLAPSFFSQARQGKSGCEKSEKRRKDERTKKEASNTIRQSPRNRQGSKIVCPS